MKCKNFSYAAGIPDIMMLCSLSSQEGLLSSETPSSAKISLLKGFIGDQNGFSDIDLLQYISLAYGKHNLLVAEKMFGLSVSNVKYELKRFAKPNSTDLRTEKFIFMIQLLIFM